MAEHATLLNNAFCLFFKLVVLLVVVGSSLFDWADGFCYNCKSNQVCCGGDCIYASSCVGFYCEENSDCAIGESCCKNACVNGSNCLGHICLSNSDCGEFEACCNQKCKGGFDCIGESCTIDFDCGTGENCCDKTCHSFACPAVPTFVIIISVLSGVLCLLSVIVVVVFIAFRRRPTGPTVLLGQRVGTATTAAQGYQIHQDQTPPSYQQSYPYYPPRSGQFPPSKASQPPPPYDAKTQGGSGGVCPQTSYSTVSKRLETLYTL